MKNLQSPISGPASRFLVLAALMALGWLTPPLLATQSAAPGRRIDPAGVPGALILCGEGELPISALDRILDLGGGKGTRLVILNVGTDQAENGVKSPARAFQEQAEARKVAAVTWLRLPSRGAANEKEKLLPLTSATVLWVVGDNPAVAAKILKDSAAAKEIQALLQRGGLVIGNGATAALLAGLRVDREAAGGGTSVGLGLLPDSILDMVPAGGQGNSRLAALMKNHPGLVGYVIAPETALVVRGRRLFALGKGQVTLHLAPSAVRPARKIVLEPGKDLADLTALRYAALARSQAEFPPRKLAPPVVEKGTLIIIGGGGMPRGMVKRFVELAGGPRAVIVVLPTANPDPLPPGDGMANAFRKAGAGKVIVLPQRKLAEVEGEEFLGALRQATGIWFGGGRQWRFADAYLDTRAQPLMLEVLRRGGVIGGSSAGASIQAEYMARGDPLGNLEILAEGYERGLGFLKGVAVDQHFSQRKRHRDMTRLIHTFPQLLGIGIDETTAIIVQGHVAEVVGQGRVYFYDGLRKVEPGQPDYEAVPSGGRYDLQTRQVLK